MECSYHHYRAQLLINQYGHDADEYAHQKMLEFMERDEVKGASIWLSIGHAMEDLRNRERQEKLY